MAEIENKSQIWSRYWSGWLDKDNRYFWAVPIGANVLGFIRIDLKLERELFSVPADVLGGDALNLENGYITVHPATSGSASLK